MAQSVQPLTNGPKVAGSTPTSPGIGIKSRREKRFKRPKKKILSCRILTNVFAPPCVF